MSAAGNGALAAKRSRRAFKSAYAVVPCAAAGSLMLTPDIALSALRAMKKQFGDKIYDRYGFTDAFNPNNGWVSPDVIGIDVGITLLIVLLCAEIIGLDE